MNWVIKGPGVFLTKNGELDQGRSLVFGARRTQDLPDEGEVGFQRNKSPVAPSPFPLVEESLMAWFCVQSHSLHELMSTELNWPLTCEWPELNREG